MWCFKVKLLVLLFIVVSAQTVISLSVIFYKGKQVENARPKVYQGN